MQTKVFEIANIGPVSIAKHHKSKRITIKLTHGKNPRVVIPTLMTYKMGLNFAIEKKEWIIEHQKKLAKNLPQQTIFDIHSFFKTRYSKIIFKQEGSKHKMVRSNDEITLTLPESIVIDSENCQQFIRKFIIEVLREEAKAHLTKRTKTLADKFGFKYNNVYIKNLKTRWGSCSAINNINLNLHLMRLPEHLSDFIILHELCHTVHKNHGPQFHDLLNTISGNEKLFNKELKKYNISF